MKKNGEHLREMWNIIKHTNVHMRLTRERGKQQKNYQKTKIIRKTKNWSGYPDVRKKQTVKQTNKQITRNRDIYSDTRVNPKDTRVNQKDITTINTYAN